MKRNPQAHLLGVALVLGGVAAHAPAVRADRSEPTFVVVSGRQDVSGNQQVCFRLDRDDIASDRISVRIRFRGAVPRGHVTLDGREGPGFVEDSEEFGFVVQPRGIHRLGIDLRDAATIDWLSITSQNAEIEQVACSQYDYEQDRDVDLRIEPPSRVDRLERDDRSRDDGRYVDRDRDGVPERSRDYRRDDVAWGAVIPAGTELDLVLDRTVSASSAHVGETVETHLASDLRVDGRTVLPDGTRVLGTVAQAQKAGRFGRSRLRVDFGRAILGDGTEVLIDGSVQRLGKGSAGKQAGIIAGSAVGGAVVGKVVGGDDQAALIGALIGGGIATGSIAAKPGQNVVLPAGTLLQVRLDTSTRIADRRTAYWRR